MRFLFDSLFLPKLPGMKEKKVYIIPTAMGMYFLFFILIMFTISMIYGHSLAYTTTFVILTATAATAILTNDHLKKIDLISRNKEYLIQAETNTFLKVSLRNNSSFEKKIKVSIFDGPKRGSSSTTLLKPCEVNTCFIDIHGRERGVYKLDCLKVHSDFPFGLFRSWFFHNVNFCIYIYPKALSEKVDIGSFQVKESLLSPYPRSSSRASLTQTSYDEFYEYKKINESEFEASSYLNYNHIDWKVYAKKNELYLKEYSENLENNQASYFVDYDHISGGHEYRLSFIITLIDQILREHTLEVNVRVKVFEKTYDSKDFLDLDEFFCTIKKNLSSL